MATDEWRTPPGLYARLDDLFGFTLDVAATDDNHLAPTWYTKQQNGLTQPWSGRIYGNPPYSDPSRWVLRAALAAGVGEAELIVMLLPVDTSTAWFRVLWDDARRCCFSIAGWRTLGAVQNRARGFRRAWLCSRGSRGGRCGRSPISARLCRLGRWPAPPAAVHSPNRRSIAPCSPRHLPPSTAGSLRANSCNPRHYTRLKNPAIPALSPRSGALRSKVSV